MNAFRCNAANQSIPVKLLDGTALVTVRGMPNGRLNVMREDCVNCLSSLLCSFDATGTIKTLFNTSGPSTYIVTDEDGTKAFKGTYSFGLLGRYTITSNGVEMETSPVSAWGGFAVMVLFFAMVFFFTKIMRIFTSRWTKNETEEPHPMTQRHDSNSMFSFESGYDRCSWSKELPHLHYTRGLAILLMIVVNYGGGGFWILRHSPWDGITIADFVFPGFLYVFGVSLAMTWNSHVLKGRTATWSVYFAFFGRLAELFAIGMLIVNQCSTSFDFANFRVMGVLQRFALCGAFIFFVEKIFYDNVVRLDDLNHDVVDRPELRPFFRLTQWKAFIFIMFACAIYTMIQMFIPIPGCPNGYMGPGGISNFGHDYNCTGGVNRLIDSFLFGSDHIYQHPSCQDLYQCISFDPEGLFSTITASYNVFMGYQGAIYYLCANDADEYYEASLSMAALNCAAGIFFHFTVLPFNKNLWTLSFAMITSCVASLVYGVISFQKWKEPYNHLSGLPKGFYYIGKHSLVIYVMSTFFEQRLPFNWPFEPSYLVQSLITAFAGMTFFIGAILYGKRKKSRIVSFSAHSEQLIVRESPHPHERRMLPTSED